MNYPIFNFDYEYTLEEIVRYLKCFKQHIVYVSIPIDFQKRGIIETQHQYRDDGLIIRLYWKPNTTAIHSGFSSYDEFMKRHKRGDFNLLGYDMVRFSHKQSIYTPTPDKETIDNYYNFVMRNRPKKPYNSNEYHLIEYLPKKTSMIPDIVFTMMIEEINNKIEFEKYYEERKKIKNINVEL